MILFFILKMVYCVDSLPLQILFSQTTDISIFSEAEHLL